MAKFLEDIRVIGGTVSIGSTSLASSTIHRFEVLSGTTSASETSVPATVYSENLDSVLSSSSNSASISLGIVGDLSSNNANQMTGQYGIAAWLQTSTSTIELTKDVSLVGILGQAQVTGFGTNPTASAVAGFRSSVLTGSADATIDKAYGLKSSISNNNTGTINEYRGLYIPDMSSVPGTIPGTASRYGLYQADGGNNYLEGSLGIGTNTPNSKLQVSFNGFLTSSENVFNSTAVITGRSGGDSFNANRFSVNYTGGTSTNHYRNIYAIAPSYTTAPAFYSYGVYGDAYNINKGVGIFGRSGNQANNIGVYGNLLGGSGAGTNYAIYGFNQMSSGSGTQYVGRFYSALNNASNTGTVYGVWSSAIRSGAAIGTGTNIGGYFNATGGNTNYAIIVPPSGGNVGIGTTNPLTGASIHVVNSETTTTKYGTYKQITGNGLSSNNYGSYAQISGGTNQQYGNYTSITGTYSNINYGNYVNMAPGKSSTYGSFININGADTGSFIGSYVNISANTGTASQNNYGAQFKNFGNGNYNTGVLSQAHNGTFANFGVWSIIGTTTPFTVGDIGVYSYVGANAKLTSYPSSAGLFTNTSSSTGTSNGIQISVTGTYSSNNIGMTINSQGSLTNNVALQTTAGDTIFNQNGGDWDFRVEGLTESNMLFVDADQDRVGIATNTPGADFEVNGFSKFGSDAPAIKTKLIEVTTPASGISAQNTAHGISGTIISCEIVCEAVDNKYIKPFDTTTANSNYTAYVTTTVCSRTSDYTTNSNIANSPLRFYITYIE